MSIIILFISNSKYCVARLPQSALVLSSLFIQMEMNCVCVYLRWGVVWEGNEPCEVFHSVDALKKC